MDRQCDYVELCRKTLAELDTNTGIAANLAALRIEARGTGYKLPPDIGEPLDGLSAKSAEHTAQLEYALSYMSQVACEDCVLSLFFSNRT